MHTKQTNWRATALTLGLLSTGLLPASNALAYSQIIAFGDSLTANGHSLDSTGTPGAPYWQGRYSNGPVAVEDLAQDLALSLSDYANGGATTSMIDTQIQTYAASLQAAHQSADPSALYFDWGGGNDLLNANGTFTTALLTTAASNMAAGISTLYGLGARNFFVPLLPDVGTTPYALTNGNANYATLAHNASVQFNALLSADLQTLSTTLPGINILSFDTISFEQTQMQNLAAQGGNVTSACMSGSGVTAIVCKNPSNYFFWDSVHPTASTDLLLGNAFASTIGSAQAVPESATLWWACAGILLVGLGATRRRDNQAIRT